MRKKFIHKQPNLISMDGIGITYFSIGISYIKEALQRNKLWRQSKRVLKRQEEKETLKKR